MGGIAFGFFVPPLISAQIVLLLIDIHEVKYEHSYGRPTSLPYKGVDTFKSTRNTVV